MHIICTSCHRQFEWKKQQHEKLKDQICYKCGGKYSRLDCFKEGCKYLQFVKCVESGFCEIRRNEKC